MKNGFIRRKCPKCGGNLYHGEESYVDGELIGFYEHESCLQCGYICYEDMRHPIKKIVSITAVQRELLYV